MGIELQYLITGCARSGTGFMSHLFNENHIKCGHEAYYNIYDNQQLQHVAESSWLATPFISDLQNVNIIRIARNPLKIIKSFLDLDFFNKKHITSPYYNYMIKYINLDILNNEPMLNCALYYLEWNKLFDSYTLNNYDVILLEDLIKQDTVIINGCKFQVPNKVVNNKKQHKVQNIPIENIVNRLKKLDMYDKVMEQYNQFLTHTWRIV